MPAATCSSSIGETIGSGKVSGGIITTVAGNGMCGYNGDNIAAISAELCGPYGVAVNVDGSLLIADTRNNRIRKVIGGIIRHQFAGNGEQSFYGDNVAASSAELQAPYGVAVDASGNLFIADTDNNRIRKVSGGIITTVVGNGMCGYNGDNIAALSAELCQPYGVAVDASGNLFIADSVNQRIRKVSGGIITTVAGNGAVGYNGDNIAATGAELNYPFGVAVDASGNLFIADCDNGRIRKVSGGIITTVAGNGVFGYNGDNIAATSAELIVLSAWRWMRVATCSLPIRSGYPQGERRYHHHRSGKWHVRLQRR